MSHKNLQQKLLASALVICFCFFRCSRKVTALYSFHLQKLLEDVRRNKFKHESSNNDINRAPPKEDSHSQATRHHNDLHKLLEDVRRQTFQNFMSNNDINGAPPKRRAVLSSHKTSDKNKQIVNIPLQQSPQPDPTKATLDSQTKTSCPTMALTEPHQRTNRTLKPEDIILTSINYFKM